MDEKVDLSLQKELNHQNKALQRKLVRAQYDLKLLQLRNDVDSYLLNITKAERDRQAEYTRILLNNCPELILFVDTQLQPLMASKEFFKLIDLPFDTRSDNIHLNKLTDKFHEDDIKKIYSIAEDSIQSKRNLSDYVTLRRNDQCILHVQVLAEPVIEQNTQNVMGVVLVIHDMTDDIKLKDEYKNQLIQAEIEKERAEKAMLEAKRSKKEADEANLAKSKFLAVMTHEIRTPLNSIIGMAEVMDTTSLTQKSKSYLESIKKSSYSLLSIINELLDFSKAEAGKLKLTNIHYDIYALIADICSVICLSAKSKQLNFTWSTSSDFPEFLYGDDIRLRQVLMNVLTNAIKYTRKGSINLSAYVQGQRLMFEICDTGIGIKQEDIEKMFLPYEQFSQNDNRYIGGTGLGLSISKYICELMGGDITVNSTYGKGSNFIITLPLVYGDELMVKKEDIILMEAPTAKILVVDNNNINLVIARSIFSLFKIEIDTAESALESLEMISKRDYHIVFMDYKMPLLDGTEALALIRQDEKNSSLVIIALSADTSSDSIQKFLDCGFDGFLSKPIEKRHLVGLLKKWLPSEVLRFTETSTAQKSPEQTFEALSCIPEIDVEFGLERMGNSHEVYTKALLMFADMISNRKYKLSKYLSNLTILDYYEEIHGIKGALSSLGFAALSKDVAELELAALNKDVEACREKAPLLMEALEELSQKIYDSCSKLSEKSSRCETEQGDKFVLKKKLLELSEMLDDYDLLSAGEAIVDICKYSYSEDIDRRLQFIKQSTDNFDVPEAVHLLADLRDIVK